MPGHLYEDGAFPRVSPECVGSSSCRMRLDQCLLVMNHFPALGILVMLVLQDPSARAYGLKGLALAGSLDTIIDQCTIFAQGDDLVMAQSEGLPGLEILSLEYLVQRGRGH